MTIVYPLTVQLDYTELRFSLRSIEKYLKPPFDVVIVGDHVPDWINNCTQIHLPDVRGRKQLSIKCKILAALALREYEKEILFLNDDVYLLKPMDEFPYYWHGYLKNCPESGSKPLMKELEAMGKATKHFDGHYALVYERDKFMEASKQFTDDCIIKSMYCNYWNIEGEFLDDCKLLTKKTPEEIRNFIQDKPCFSTGVYSLQSALPVLEKLFPNPSIYELT